MSATDQDNILSGAGKLFSVDIKSLNTVYPTTSQVRCAHSDLIKPRKIFLSPWRAEGNEQL